ncbi:MAG: type I 3-dehydroquinate dehydratase [Microgenomates group bacterium]
MKTHLCSVAMGKTMDELLENISLCKRVTPFVEVRSDYLNIQSEIDVKRIGKMGGKKSIFTCRRKDEGGNWQGSEEDRLLLLRRAFVCGFSYIDVELKTLEEGVFSIPKGMEGQSIVSFHNFKLTASEDELQNIISRMRTFSPGIMKIATLVREQKDAMTLYKILITRRMNEQMCVIGMGNMGRQTRIIAPLLGGSLSYCSINSEGSAPGQMTCDEMKNCYRLLR